MRMSPIHIKGKPKYLLNRPDKRNWRTEKGNQYAVFIGKSEFIPGAIFVFANSGKWAFFHLGSPPSSTSETPIYQAFQRCNFSEKSDTASP